MRREERARVFNEGIAAGKADARGEIARLRAALAAIVAAWNSVSPDADVPDEINRDELWEAARLALPE
jgi:hypothetical protein